MPVLTSTFRKGEREGTISLIRDLLIKIFVSTVHFEVDLFSFSHQKFSKLDMIMLGDALPTSFQAF